MKCALRTASGEILLILKEALVTLTLGLRALTIWVFIANIAYGFILGLNVMHALDASVDLRRHMLRLGDEELPLRSPGRDCIEHLV
jgi:hypothetical protein